MKICVRSGKQELHLEQHFGERKTNRADDAYASTKDAVQRNKNHVACLFLHLNHFHCLPMDQSV